MFSQSNSCLDHSVEWFHHISIMLSQTARPYTCMHVHASVLRTRTLLSPSILTQTLIWLLSHKGLNIYYSNPKPATKPYLRRWVIYSELTTNRMRVYSMSHSNTCISINSNPILEIFSAAWTHWHTLSQTLMKHLVTLRLDSRYTHQSPTDASAQLQSHPTHEPRTTRHTNNTL